MHVINIAVICVTIFVLGDVISRSYCETTTERLVVYNLTFKTFWSEELFEKQYPRYRPPAQWSRLEGNLAIKS